LIKNELAFGGEAPHPVLDVGTRQRVAVVAH
jgi:hypothetical protein